MENVLTQKKCIFAENSHRFVAKSVHKYRQLERRSSCSIEQKMLGFSQLLKPIKWQDLLEEGKNSRNAFRTGAKIDFSDKNILALGEL